MKKKNKFLIGLTLSTACIFGLASCQGAQGAKGDQGESGLNGKDGTDGKDGINGSSVLTGKGVPASTLGNDGDSYIDTDTFDFYSKKSGSWSKIGNIKGNTGEQGNQGSQGETGKKGTSLLSGSGIPSSTLGSDGDSYIDITTYDFYSKANGEWKKYGNFKGVDGTKGETGETGETGKNGSSVLTGNGEPASTLGNDGDSYIDLESFDFYTKENGTWEVVGNIKGDKGDQGDKGDKGNSGWSGSKGDKGDIAYSSTILSSEGGYIIPSVGSQIAGKEITYTINVNSGYALTALRLIGSKNSYNYDLENEKIKEVDAGKVYTCTVDMEEGGFVVSADFETSIKTITLTHADVGRGTIETSDGKNQYAPGTKVTINFTVFSGFEFDRLTITPEASSNPTIIDKNTKGLTNKGTNSQGGTDYTFIYEMPNKNVTIKLCANSTSTPKQ